MGLSPLSPFGRFGPLAEGHPGVGMVCPGCGVVLVVGDRPSLVDGVPASDEDAVKAAAGRAHNAEARIAHEACAWPCPPVTHGAQVLQITRSESR